MEYTIPFMGDCLTDLNTLINSYFNKPMKVIFNNNTTILYVGTKKYVSIAKGEPFDEEKGLLMCLMKAQILLPNYTALRKLIDSAKRYGTANK